MRKSFFLSVLALAAVVSCQKSEIVDSKYGNDEIGFETYAGRDAMTKATVVSDGNIATAGLYGFYTATKEWGNGDNQMPAPTPNLWANAEITKAGNWAPTDKKYWTNADDFYSFLAYSPFATGTGETGNGLVATTTANPTVTYTVPTTLTSQVDLLYANDATHVNTHKPTTAGTPVTLKFNHALSRISVWAAETHPDYTYTITAITLKGGFAKTNTFDLKSGKWETASATETDAYSFVLNGGNVAISTNTHVSCTGDEYLMIIPAEVQNAELNVTYTTTYGSGENALVSTPITKMVPVNQTFKQGCAYALNLTFGPNEDDLIEFSVSVSDWVNESGEANKETGVNAGNPEEGTLVE